MRSAISRTMRRGVFSASLSARYGTSAAARLQRGAPLLPHPHEGVLPDWPRVSFTWPGRSAVTPLRMWRTGCEGVIEAGGESPDVHRGRRLAEVDDLLAWHEHRLARRGTGPGEAAEPGLIEGLADAVVRDLRRHGAVQENVGRGEIAVDDAVVMGVLQSAQSLQGQRDGLVGREAATSLGQEVVETAAGAVLGGQVASHSAWRPTPMCSPTTATVPRIRLPRHRSTHAIASHVPGGVTPDRPAPRPPHAPRGQPAQDRQLLDRVTSLLRRRPVVRPRTRPA